MPLIESRELMMGRHGPAARLLAALLMRLLGLNRLNRLYDAVRDSGDRCTEEALRWLEISYRVCDKDRSNIPPAGGVIFLANHPTGALDGILLIDLLARSRPDVRFLGNFLLERIEPLAHYFISVDPFDPSTPRRNYTGMRQALEHVRKRGALVIFPAGEVATWQKGFSRVKDKPWSHSVIRFVRRAEVPIVPLCIEARNSTLFHLLGKIHPLLRTALLPHELLNKRGKSVYISIGSALLPRKLASLESLTTYGDYLRANVEYLCKKKPRRHLRILPKHKPQPRSAETVADSKGTADIMAELEKIRTEYRLFEQAEFEVFCTPPEAIPNLMHEIGRLREMTFREVGEGTMKALDTDRYDAYYHQFFIWDNTERSVVGAYRLGMGDQIIPRYGVKGFYTDSLFRMGPEMAPILEKTIELGRSFVVREYQRKPVSLMLLWKGILYVLLKHEQYRNLLGPVTISGEFDKNAKTLIVGYLQQHHFNPKLARHIHPVTGLQGIDAPLDLSLIAGIHSIDLINKIVRDIERDEMSIPILIKKYLQLNSHVLAFNVDHDFCDSLDALMLLDLKKVPEKTIAMLSKEITDIDVIRRFRHIN